MKITKKILSLLLVLVMVLSTVTPVQAATVKLNKTKATIYVGKSVTLKLTGTTKKATWSSSNKSVATVSSGKVTGKKAGSATITAKLGSKKYTCKITVKDYTLKVSSTKLGIDQNGCNFIFVTTNADTITASSSNKKVAQVDVNSYLNYDGSKTVTIWGIGAGSATITVKAGNTKKTVKVTVEEHEEFVSRDEFALSESEAEVFGLDGYTNFVDWQINEYMQTKETYLLSCDKKEDMAAKSNREITIGSTWNEVLEAYGNSYDGLGTYDGQDALYMMNFIEPTTGLHFYKIFVLDGSDDSANNKVVKIIWDCYMPSSKG